MLDVFAIAFVGLWAPLRLDRGMPHRQPVFDRQAARVDVASFVHGGDPLAKLLFGVLAPSPHCGGLGSGPPARPAFAPAADLLHARTPPGRCPPFFRCLFPTSLSVRAT